jgi:hypothetical protein
MNDDARTINGYTALLTSIGAGTVAVIHDALDELAEGRVVEHLRDRPSPLQSLHLQRHPAGTTSPLPSAHFFSYAVSAQDDDS